ncbi:hypothetical protein CF67_08002 [Candidatus Photodesmus blepharus]|uniref:Metallo-beta-lactamase domain-containing protein n=1 Tax=Candidatus Photodesmus blepharonis TaxID=1179155 RepID=A0A084CM88_9GAMM|nr:MBL fold metallo-hydrolase [Candidatus Photodesmus blepharus]KEY90917.1 hypothetical protein CF67_08002 [Candidatus Photodesmus blepharus]
MSIKYRVVPVTSFSQNCSIVWCDETMEGIVIDPGGNVEKLSVLIQKLQVNVLYLTLTHGHLDHVGGTKALAEVLGGVEIVGPHKDDNFWLRGLKNQSQIFNFPLTEAFKPNRWLTDGDQIKFGNQVLDVLHTPGHTPGHVVFFNENEKLAFVGDVLFNGSIGRTDFPKGDFDALINSIKMKLLPLGDSIRFVPGHGPESTFGHERNSNPFLHLNKL